MLSALASKLTKVPAIIAPQMTYIFCTLPYLVATFLHIFRFTYTTWCALSYCFVLSLDVPHCLDSITKMILSVWNHSCSFSKWPHNWVNVVIYSFCLFKFYSIIYLGKTHKTAWVCCSSTRTCLQLIDHVSLLISFLDTQLLNALNPFNKTQMLCIYDWRNLVEKVTAKAYWRVSHIALTVWWTSNCLMR